MTPKCFLKHLEKYSDGLRQAALSRSVPLEALFGDSIITAIGSSELWVENYKALILYEKERILIQAKSYMISIEGTNLSISHYMEEHMMVKGNIRNITYL